MPRLRFVNEQVEVEVAPGRDLRAAAREAGIELCRGLWVQYHCRGLGLCGGCTAWVRPEADGAASPPTFWEKLRWHMRGRQRLGCQVRILGDCEVRTAPGGPPPPQTVEAYLRAPGRAPGRDGAGAGVAAAARAPGAGAPAAAAPAAVAPAAAPTVAAPTVAEPAAAEPAAEA